jgi:hypothetical protein
LDVHEALSQHGLEAARRLAATKTERAAIEVAAYLLDLPAEMDTVVHAGLLAAALPHKAPGPASAIWRKALFGGGALSLESGVYADGAPIGLPFGSKARMILYYLQDQAVRAGRREVPIGASMHAWLRAIGSPSAGGMTYKVIQDQARRLATCRFTLTDAGGRVDHGRFIDHLIRPQGSVDDIPYRREIVREVFPSSAALGRLFFEETRAAPISVSLAALRCISNNSVALDLYLYLAAHLPGLSGPEVVTWAQIAPSFGVGYRNPARMRPAFLRALQMALAVYPRAGAEVIAGGVRLHPAPPPVSVGP